MKKLNYLLSFSCISIILAGCISIPIGDNVLEISTDGIEFVDNGEENEPEEEEVTEAEDAVGEPDGEVEETVNETSNETAEENTETDSDDTAKQCEEQDYSAVTDDLQPGFFIPDCALLSSVSKDSNGLDAYFTVEGGDWQEIFKAYKEFFGDSLNQERQNPASENAELSAALYENSNDYTTIQIDQGDEGVSLRIIQRFPEEE